MNDVTVVSSPFESKPIAGFIQSTVQSIVPFKLCLPVDHDFTIGRRSSDLQLVHPYLGEYSQPSLTLHRILISTGAPHATIHVKDGGDQAFKVKITDNNSVNGTAVSEEFLPGTGNMLLMGY